MSCPSFVFFLCILIVPLLHDIILFALVLYINVMRFLCNFLGGTCSFALLLCFMFFLHIVVMFMFFLLVACIAPHFLQFVDLKSKVRAFLDDLFLMKYVYFCFHFSSLFYFSCFGFFFFFGFDILQGCIWCNVCFCSCFIVQNL
jgi:hypothetical protein